MSFLVFSIDFRHRSTPASPAASRVIRPRRTMAWLAVAQLARTAAHATTFPNGARPDNGATNEVGITITPEQILPQRSGISDILAVGTSAIRDV